MKNLACCVLCLLMLTGCSFRSQQLEMAQQMAAGSGSRVNPDEFAWLMRFNETEARVYAVSVGNGIVFANEEGLEIAFDGWDVMVVSGMPGSLGTIVVDKSGSPRVHRVQGLDESFEVHCEEPVRRLGGWDVSCRHDGDDRVYRMDHRIGLTESGRINRIEASLLPGAGPLVLTPLFDIGN